MSEGRVSRPGEEVGVGQGGEGSLVTGWEGNMSVRPEGGSVRAEAPRADSAPSPGPKSRAPALLTRPRRPASPR